MKFTGIIHESKITKTLEYYKIIDQLEGYASCESGKELCRNLVPSIDLEEIVRMQRETTDAVTRVRQKGGISFGGVKDIRASLKRLDVGSSLNIIEILAISNLQPEPKPTEGMRIPNFQKIVWKIFLLRWNH